MRYGGDEFAVIIPENGDGGEESGNALHTAERIRSRVEEFRWESLGLPQHPAVTVSIGVAVVEPGEHAGSAHRPGRSAPLCREDRRPERRVRNGGDLIQVSRVAHWRREPAAAF